MTNIGKVAIVIDKYSMYFGEWGIIVDVDSDNCYYLAIAGDKSSTPVFDRCQIKIRRKRF